MNMSGGGAAACQGAPEQAREAGATCWGADDSHGKHALHATWDLLQSTPESWQHQLIAGLCTKDKLSLFRVCRQMACQVMRSAPKLCLMLHSTPECRPFAAVSLLLEAGRELSVIAQPYDDRKLPTALAPLVTELTRGCIREACGAGRGTQAEPTFSWSSLTNIQTVRYRWASYYNVAALLEAVELGHLRRLNTLHLHIATAELNVPTTLLSQSFTDVPDCRLFNVVGPQITTLGTNDRGLLQHLHLFTSLRRLKLYRCVVTSGPATQQLFCHTSLEDVKMTHCSLGASCVHYVCTWKTLFLEDCNPLVLTWLPLSSMGDVQILLHEGVVRELHSASPLEQVIAQYRSKIQFVPYTSAEGSFEVCFVRPGNLHLLLVAQLRQPCKIKISQV